MYHRFQHLWLLALVVPYHPPYLLRSSGFAEYLGHRNQRFRNMILSPIFDFGKSNYFLWSLISNIQIKFNILSILIIILTPQSSNFFVDGTEAGL